MTSGDANPCGPVIFLTTPAEMGFIYGRKHIDERP